jgi:hypothetical protein
VPRFAEPTKRRTRFRGSDADVLDVSHQTIGRDLGNLSTVDKSKARQDREQSEGRRSMRTRSDFVIAVAAVALLMAAMMMW